MGIAFFLIYDENMICMTPLFSYGLIDVLSPLATYCLSTEIIVQYVSNEDNRSGLLKYLKKTDTACRGHPFIIRR